MGQIRFIEVVAQLQPRVRLPVQQPLDLERQIAKASCEQRILAVAFDGKASQRTPFRTDKLWLPVSRQHLLVEPRQKDRSARRFSHSTQITPGIFNQAARACEGGLARRNLLPSQTDSSASPRKSNRPRRYVPASVRDLESESIGNLIAVGLVHFDQRCHIRLIGDWLART